MTTVNQINVGLSGASGTGSFAGTTSPTLVTPTLGAATATSITFGGSVLSTYVANSWTPTITYQTPGDLSVSYNTHSGLYTQVGKMAIVSFNLIFTPTFTTASGFIKISSIPVSISTGGGDLAGTVILYGVTYPAAVTYAAVSPLDATNLLIKGCGSTLTNTNFGVTQFASGSQYTVVGSITYVTT